MPIRIEKELLDMLSEGSKRTPHKKQELIRLTLRRHLREVIEEEARHADPARVTAIEPWPKGALAAAYRRISREGWDAIETAAVRATQKSPSFED